MILQYTILGTSNLSLTALPQRECATEIVVWIMLYNMDPVEPTVRIFLILQLAFWK